jgi:hypothetical protein
MVKSPPNIKVSYLDAKRSKRSKYLVNTKNIKEVHAFSKKTNRKSRACRALNFNDIPPVDVEKPLVRRNLF